MKLLLCLLFSLKLFAGTVQFSSVNDDIVYPGDIKTFTLNFFPWPKYYSFEPIQKLNNTFLGNNYYVVSIKHIDRSVNNDEVLSVKLELAYAPLAKENGVLKINKTEYKIDDSALSLNQKMDPQKFKEGYYLFQHKTASRVKTEIYFRYIAIIALILGCISLIYIYYKKIKSKKRAEISQALYRKEFFSKYSKAVGRKEYEELYKKRDRLIKAFPEAKNSFKQLFAEIDHRQYKEVWSENDISNLSNLTSKVIKEASL